MEALVSENLVICISVVVYLERKVSIAKLISTSVNLLLVLRFLCDIRILFILFQFLSSTNDLITYLYWRNLQRINRQIVNCS